MRTLERDYSLVQPIVVLQDGAEHEATVAAAAQASVESFKKDSEKWQTWRSENYAKSVRRAKGKEFAKILALGEESDWQWSLVKRDGASAIAFEPFTYVDMPKAVRRAQVGGTEFPREKGRLTSAQDVFKVSPIIAVNDDLGMSTGKCAAQVAHGLWLAEKIYGERIDLYPVDVAYASDAAFKRAAAAAKGVITDSGLTELSGPTRTILVL